MGWILMAPGIFLSNTHKCYYLVTFNTKRAGCLGVISDCEGVKGMCVVVCGIVSYRHSPTLLPCGTYEKQADGCIQVHRGSTYGPGRRSLCLCMRASILPCLSRKSWMSWQDGGRGDKKKKKRWERNLDKGQWESRKSGQPPARSYQLNGASWLHWCICVTALQHHNVGLLSSPCAFRSAAVLIPAWPAT